MKKLMYIGMIATASLAFTACNSEGKDAKETSDSLNEAKDTSSNTAETGGMAAPQDDAEFATAAATSGMAEVEFGKLALEKSTNAQIKEFANMMVNDHGKANAELEKLAMAKNITLPATLDEKHKEKQADLTKATGTDFDKKYVDAMVEGHEMTLDLMQKEAKDGKDADLKAFAGKTSTTVEAHLNMIKKIQDSMKNK
ncbi:DUF305 domain-containing protein [Pedobacter yulinensis]|uniref:DUF305 domain-containing protein n=1 Tax=Pedobacter yulinensis TaxID=2126353 RepID=A0A2T3HK73_9SPHI|nr:DUF4142 domain-containing protein [Pedobacter yulinensis]PST82819.1 DUF305 domain-containing protein [Pedobacter yulinensis]